MSERELSYEGASRILHHLVDEWYEAAHSGLDTFASANLDEIVAIVEQVRP